ncbi:MAG TPA: hypothetical protein VFZ21_11640, partial [Gemmatimonadaceae bacterium]|nr:hypothetical protein [Gemmatimonadaceae bacterium]
MIASTVFYAGLVAAFIGLLAMLRPIRSLRLTRARGASLALAGLTLAVIGLLSPAPERRVPQRVTRLDEFAPVYQFVEFHSTRVMASPEGVHRAIRDVTAGEIPVFQLFTWVRRFGRSGPENILNVPDDTAILDVATRTGFLPLADDSPREVVIGTVVLAPDGWVRSDAPTPDAYKALRTPGFATATMNFLITPHPSGGVMLSTETRVHATDEASRRRFGIYWRVIYPGSALIRRGWLRAIRFRAETATKTTKALIGVRV